MKKYGDCFLYFNPANHMLSCGYKKNVVGIDYMKHTLKKPPFYEILTSGNRYKYTGRVIRDNITGRRAMVITWYYYTKFLKIHKSGK